jgi:hypothetical protein
MQTSTKNNIAWAIRIIVAFLFIISAIAKMYPSPYFAISTFEVKQLYTLGFSENIAPYFSRILIGIEMALGLLLLQNHWLRKFIVPMTILLLVIFVLHLTYVTFLSGGNSGNCGCFGELLPMTPIEAIIKNLVAIGLLVYLYKLLSKNDSLNFWILTTVLFASILGIFMLAPIRPAESNFSVSPVVEPIEDSTYNENNTVIDSAKTAIVPSTTKIDSVKKEIKKTEEVVITNAPKQKASGNKKFFSKIDTDKQVLCYFVPGCDHCRVAAKELTELKQKDKNFPPISILFMNEEAELIPNFFKEAGANYPYKIIEIIPFWNILGSGKDTPGVKYFWNGNEIKYYWGTTDNKFNAAEFHSYIQKSYDELKKNNSKL